MTEAAALLLRAFDAPSFVLVLARVGGVVTFFPLLGAEVIPPRFRIFLAAALAFLLRPLVAQAPLSPGTSLLDAGGRIALEFLVGAALGFSTQVALSAFEAAGQLVGFQMGLTLSGVIDPVNGEQTTPISTLYRFLAIVLYFSLDAHHAFLIALRDSYAWVGGMAAPGGAFAHGAIRISAEIFPLALRIAAPALVVSLIVDVALLLAARALPQVNLLILGYPAKTALGLLAIAAGLVVLPRVAGESLRFALDEARHLTAALASGR